jgi:hypothetical protein
MRRGDFGEEGSELYTLEGRHHLAKELGDVVIYADLCAHRIGTTLEKAVRAAFNDKSEDLKMDYRLEETEQ